MQAKLTFLLGIRTSPVARPGLLRTTSGAVVAAGFPSDETMVPNQESERLQHGFCLARR